MSTTARELRLGLDHPVIDADGHILEPSAILYDFLTELAGSSVARKILLAAGAEVSMGDASQGIGRVGWWATPTNARDLAAVMAPKLLYERLDEFGIDFSIVYPSAGLAMVSLPDAELRQIGVRAVNDMIAYICRDVVDRVTPGALIPMNTPEEAINELRHVRLDLGMKVAAIPPVVARPIPMYRDAYPAACHLDSFGLDSPYDYDPVWAQFVELGMAVNSHGALVKHLPFGGRSPSSFVFNHISAHGFQQDHLCKSLVLGGVPQRFPSLNFAFLECGVLWAMQLLQALVVHWEKRGPIGLHRTDPSLTDRDHLHDLLERYGGEQFAASIPFRVGRRHDHADDKGLKEFAAASIGTANDIVKIFDRFFFGCEGDDRGVADALRKRGPFPTRLQAFFSSDIGHWDVVDPRDVLLESYELREEGFLAEDDFKDFVFRHAVLLHGGMNPDFFAGTTVETEAQLILQRNGLVGSLRDPGSA